MNSEGSFFALPSLRRGTRRAAATPARLDREPCTTGLTEDELDALVPDEPDPARQARALDTARRSAREAMLRNAELQELLEDAGLRDVAERRAELARLDAVLTTGRHDLRCLQEELRMLRRRIEKEAAALDALRLTALVEDTSRPAPQLRVLA